MRLYIKRWLAVLVLTVSLLLSPGLSAIASAAAPPAVPKTSICYSTDLSNCKLITQYVNPFINFLAALVGIAVVISMAVGGIQYSSAGGDPGKVSAAKKRIRDALVALLVFALLYTVLNFLIPGGII